MKANALLKHNIDAILRKRGHSRQELAMHCLRTTARNRAASWISHIFGKAGYETREIPLKYLDRIASFFGLEVYQLFQPGITPVTERRSGKERRSGQDRRIGATRHNAVPVTPVRHIPISPQDEAFLAELRDLSYKEFERIRHWVSIVRLGRPVPRETGDSGDPAKIVGLPVAPVVRTRAGRKKTQT